MAIAVECQHCKTKAEVPDSAAGARGKCRVCGAVVHVPAAANSSTSIIACRSCGAKNRIGEGRTARARCGRCREFLEIALEAVTAKAQFTNGDEERTRPPDDLFNCPSCNVQVTRADMDESGICKKCASGPPFTVRLRSAILNSIAVVEKAVIPSERNRQERKRPEHARWWLIVLVPVTVFILVFLLGLPFAALYAYYGRDVGNSLPLEWGPALWCDTNVAFYVGLYGPPIYLAGRFLLSLPGLRWIAEELTRDRSKPSQNPVVIGINKIMTGLALLLVAGVLIGVGVAQYSKYSKRTDEEREPPSGPLQVALQPAPQQPAAPMPERSRTIAGTVWLEFQDGRTESMALADVLVLPNKMEAANKDIHDLLDQALNGIRVQQQMDDDLAERNPQNFTFAELRATRAPGLAAAHRSLDQLLHQDTVEIDAACEQLFFERQLRVELGASQNVSTGRQIYSLDNDGYEHSFWDALIRLSVTRVSTGRDGKFSMNLNSLNYDLICRKQLNNKIVYWHAPASETVELNNSNSKVLDYN